MLAKDGLGLWEFSHIEHNTACIYIWSMLANTFYNNNSILKLTRCLAPSVLKSGAAAHLVRERDQTDRWSFSSALCNYRIIQYDDKRIFHKFSAVANFWNRVTAQLVCLLVWSCSSKRHDKIHKIFSHCKHKVRTGNFGENGSHTQAIRRISDLIYSWQAGASPQHL